MKRIIGSPALTFVAADRRRLTQALRTQREVRAYRRVQAVWAIAHGQSWRQAAAGAGCSRRAVQLWVQRYLRRHAVADLADAPRSGRPPVVPALTDRRLRREFAKDPQALGYAATDWTVPLLAGHLARRCGCPIRLRTLRRRMKRLELCWKRTRPFYKNRAEHIGQKKGAFFGGCAGF